MRETNLDVGGVQRTGYVLYRDLVSKFNYLKYSGKFTNSLLLWGRLDLHDQMISEYYYPI